MKLTADEYELVETLREWSADGSRLHFIAAKTACGNASCKTFFIVKWWFAEAWATRLSRHFLGLISMKLNRSRTMTTDFVLSFEKC